MWLAHMFNAQSHIVSLIQLKTGQKKKSETVFKIFLFYFIFNVITIIIIEYYVSCCSWQYLLVPFPSYQAISNIC